MKPRFEEPHFDLVREGRADGVLTGVGLTLLIVDTILLGVVLLGVVPAVYDLMQQMLGSGVQQLKTLSFAAAAGGGLFVGVLIAEVLFALLLSRARKPGTALLIEGILVTIFLAALTSMITTEVRGVIAGAVQSLGAAGMQHIPAP